MGSEWHDVGLFRDRLCQQPGVTCPGRTPSPLSQALAAAADSGMIFGGGPAGGRTSGAPAVNRILLRSPSQVQSKFKHAADFGVRGNYSKANAAGFAR
jgi:hypothetical protein